MLPCHRQTLLFCLSVSDDKNVFITDTLRRSNRYLFHHQAGEQKERLGGAVQASRRCRRSRDSELRRSRLALPDSEIQ